MLPITPADRCVLAVSTALYTLPFVLTAWPSLPSEIASLKTTFFYPSAADLKDHQAYQGFYGAWVTGLMTLLAGLAALAAGSLVLLTTRMQIRAEDERALASKIERIHAFAIVLSTELTVTAGYLETRSRALTQIVANPTADALRRSLILQMEIPDILTVSWEEVIHLDASIVQQVRLCVRVMRVHERFAQELQNDIQLAPMDVEYVRGGIRQLAEGYARAGQNARGVVDMIRNLYGISPPP